MVRFNATLRRWLRHSHVGFDTSFLISLLENEEEKRDLVTRLFEILEKRFLLAATSTVTLLEVLVHPYCRKETDTIQRYYGYLTRAPFIKLVPVNVEIADQAAELRARYGFKTPDAIQLATALIQKATLFLTRDKEFLKQKEIEVGIL